jgi:fructose-specific phosphotransferase system IIC component
MSMPAPAEPMPPTALPAESVLVEPDAVATLAAELSLLAAELLTDASSCEAAGASFVAALGASEGWRPCATANAWAVLYRLLAGRTAALAATMAAAVAATVAHDGALAARIGTHLPDQGTGPR